MVTLFILVFILLALIVVFYILNRRKKVKGKHITRKVKLTFEDNQASFVVEGNTDEFVIKKDNRFEFLVKDGLIVACKDLKRHENFIFYKEL
jgi:hypothetical protein